MFDIDLISVIVPVYNVERYLGQCLDSLVNQTYQNLEIICVDDGSTDTSLDLIQAYAARDNRFKVISKENRGYGHSVNLGMAHASGKYIGILESDDFAEPTMFEELHKKAVEYDADVVKSDFFFYWSDHRGDVVAKMIPECVCNQLVSPSQFGDKDLFGLQPSIWSCLYKKEFLQNNGIVFLETPGASYQDLAFNFKTFACAERMFFLDKPFVHYRQDNVASSINSTGKIFCVCDEHNSIRSFLKEKEMWTQPLITYFLDTQTKNWTWNLNRLSASRKSQSLFIDRLFSEFQQWRECLPDFDQLLESLNANPFLICLNRHPRITKFAFLYFGKQCRILSGPKCIRMKIFGIRAVKIPR